MDNYSQIFRDITGPNLFRDMVMAVGGFTALAIVELSSTPSILTQLAERFPSRFELDVTLVVISFATGKLLKLFAELCEEAYVSLTRFASWILVEKKFTHGNVGQNWRAYLNAFIQTSITRERTGIVSDISYAELTAEIKDNPAGLAFLERNVLSVIFSEVTFGVSFFAAIWLDARLFWLALLTFGLIFYQKSDFQTAIQDIRDYVRKRQDGREQGQPKSDTL